MCPPIILFAAEIVGSCQFLIGLFSNVERTSIEELKGKIKKGARLNAFTLVVLRLLLTLQQRSSAVDPDFRPCDVRRSRRCEEHCQLCDLLRRAGFATRERDIPFWELHRNFTLSRLRSSVLSLMSVSIAPGQITLTRILNGASSSADILATATCAVFVAEYAVAPVLLKVRVPFTDDVMRIEPPPPCFRCGTAYLIVKAHHASKLLLNSFFDGLLHVFDKVARGIDQSTPRFVAALRGEQHRQCHAEAYAHDCHQRRQHQAITFCAYFGVAAVVPVSYTHLTLPTNREV